MGRLTIIKKTHFELKMMINICIDYGDRDIRKIDAMMMLEMMVKMATR